MKRHSNLSRVLVYGFLSWFIPFGISILFYNRSGELLIGHDFFKSTMVATGALSGCILMFLYFRKLAGNYLAAGISLGLSWFAINVGLDLLFLLPMMKVDFNTYFTTIGLQYTVIPVIASTIGLVLKSHQSGEKIASVRTKE